MNWLHTRSKQTVVVDFGRGSIKLAVAETAGEAVRFRGVTKLELPRDEDGRIEVDDALIAERIGAEVGRNGWTRRPGACLLSGAATSTQSFVVPPMPDAELRQALELKLSETLHFDVEDACFDFRRVREIEVDGRRKHLVLVVAARTEAVERAVDVLRRAGLKPTAVGAASESLANLTYYASLRSEEEATIHADLGAESTILNLFEGRFLRFSREIDIAGDEFTRALMRPIITPAGPLRLTREQAEEVKLAAGYPLEHPSDGSESALFEGEPREDSVELPHGVHAEEILPLLEPVAQRLTTELRRSMEYLRGIVGRPSIDRIVISGSAATMRNLDVVLEENLETHVVRDDPVARATAHWRLAICDENPPSSVGFSAILGYSLGNHEPINLIPREVRIEQVVERVTTVRRALTPSAAALAVALALVAIPIDANYGRVRDQMQVSVDELDEQLATEIEFGERLDRARAMSEFVAGEAGLAPDWIGILKELPTILPDEVQLTRLAMDSAKSTRTIHLVARIHPGRLPTELVIDEVTEVLSHSPFFTNVRVLNASVDLVRSGGSFEAKLDVVASPVDLLGATP